MSYRIKVPAKIDPLDETHLLSGVEQFLLMLQEQRRALLVGLGVLLVAAAVVIGVMWYDDQTTLKARELDQEADTSLSQSAGGRSEESARATDSGHQPLQTGCGSVSPNSCCALSPLSTWATPRSWAMKSMAWDRNLQAIHIARQLQPLIAGLVQQRLAYADLMKGDRDQAAKAFAGHSRNPRRPQ